MGGREGEGRKALLSFSPIGSTDLRSNQSLLAVRRTQTAAKVKKRLHSIPSVTLVGIYKRERHGSDMGSF